LVNLVLYQTQEEKHARCLHSREGKRFLAYGQRGVKRSGVFRSTGRRKFKQKKNKR